MKGFVTRKFNVILPVTGVFYVEVDAEDENAAISAALEKDLKTSDIEEWEVHRHAIRGNVVYFNPYKASAEDIGPADEEGE